MSPCPQLFRPWRGLGEDPVRAPQAARRTHFLGEGTVKKNQKRRDDNKTRFAFGREGLLGIGGQRGDLYKDVVCRVIFHNNRI